jgi:hypothetical protein
MHDDLAKAVAVLGAKIPAIARAAERTQSSLERFKSIVLELLEKSNLKEVLGGDIVLLGSIARQEMTQESDCDYIVLQNGCLPHVSRKLLEIGELARKQMQFSPPGRQGVFGDIVIAGSLYERIGLETDTNQNLTHRTLLLTESRSVLSGPANKTYDTVVANILTRYCADYSPPERKEDSPAMVPRYLVNDLVRFWRTMAVDFAAKRWRSSVDESLLRLIKLRTTRKILFAGPLCSLLLVPNRTKVVKELSEYLRVWLGKPPLVQLASIACDECFTLSDQTKKALKGILEAYDRLLSLFDERGVRHAIEDRAGAAQIFQKTTQECKEIGETIQKNLELLFFDEPAFKDVFRKYSVF